MALIKCPECGKEVSDRAQSCIHCGYPLSELKSGEGSSTSLNERKKEGEPFSICCKCRKKVSTRSEKCPHCGCVLVKRWYNDENICRVNGVDYDMTPFMQLIHPEGMKDMLTPMKEMEKLTNCEFVGSIMGRAHRNNGIMPKEFNGPPLEDNENKENVHAVSCKYCGSTNIKRLGFLDSMAMLHAGLQWHCNNCGSDF